MRPTKFCRCRSLKLCMPPTSGTAVNRSVRSNTSSASLSSVWLDSVGLTMANSDACDFDRFLIGTIMHLLEDHQPHRRIQFLGGPAMAVMIMPAQQLDGQFR